MKRGPPLPEDPNFLKETVALLKDDEGAAAGKSDASKRKVDIEEDPEASTSSTWHPLKKRKATATHRKASDAEDALVDVSS